MPTTAAPPRRQPDPTGAIAALYPVDLPAAQALLARSSVTALAGAGRPARLGTYGIHATADVTVGASTLVLVPMAGLADLDADVAAEDGADPAVWHLHARGPSGALLEPALGHGCPSVLWAVRAGIDPAAAVALVDAALADPLVAALLDAGRSR